MICDQFVECIRGLEQRILPLTKNPKNRKYNQRKKSDVSNEQRKIVYSGYSCQDKVLANRCIKYFDKRSKARCTENGKAYILDKRDETFDVLCMHVDGGIIDDSTCDKCDYVMFLQDGVDDGAGRAVYIELKGKNTKHAIEQLIATLKRFKSIETIYRRIYARIVNASSVPRIRNTDSYIELQELVMTLGGNLKIHEQIFEEKYVELDKI